MPSPKKTDRPRILALGLGNMLLRDEGVGGAVVGRLLADYSFPDTVTAVDGGTLGDRLLPLFEQCDRLIVIDAMRGGSPPGTIYRRELDMSASPLVAPKSAHDAGFLDIVARAHALGILPPTVVLGIEPDDCESFEIGQTPAVAAAMDTLTRMTVEEIIRSGGACTRHDSRRLSDFPDNPSV